MPDEQSWIESENYHRGWIAGFHGKKVDGWAETKDFWEGWEDGKKMYLPREVVINGRKKVDESK